MVWQFKSNDLAPVAARGCGCILVRTKSYTKTLPRQDRLYTCSMCDREGKGNRQERSLMDQVKVVVRDRPERVLVCCQLPVAEWQSSETDMSSRRLRCDMVLVPDDAQHAHHMIGVELDGVDHEHKPRQYGRDSCEAYTATVYRDARKREAVLAMGMTFLRVSISDSERAWVKELHQQLDSISENMLVNPMQHE